MKILILGFGRVGRLICYLISREFPGKFDFSAIDIFRLENTDFPLCFVDDIPFLDVNIENLTPTILDDFDFVFNTLPYTKVDGVIETLKKTSSCSYFDACLGESGIPITETLKSLRNQDRRLFLSLIGISPGISNLMVSKLVKDEQVRECSIYLLEHSLTPEIPSWSELDDAGELFSSPVKYEGGKFIDVENWSGEENVLFHVSDEFKSSKICKFYNWYNDEIKSLPILFPNLQLEIKVGGNEIEEKKKKYFEIKKKEENGEEELEDYFPVLKKVVMKKGMDAKGVFGILVRSKSWEYEIVFKSTLEFRKSGDQYGNHISLPTAYSIVSFFKLCCLNEKPEDNVFGILLPELLPENVQKNIIDDVTKEISSFHRIEKL